MDTPQPDQPFGTYDAKKAAKIKKDAERRQKIADGKLVFYNPFSEEGRKIEKEKRERMRAAGNARKISQAGTRTAGGVLACPKCGGTSFKSKRSAGGKMTAGVLAPKTRVRCETCGAQYLRG